MRKLIYLFLLLIITAVFLLLFTAAKLPPSPKTQSEDTRLPPAKTLVNKTVDGKIIAVSPKSNVVVIKTPQKEISIALTAKTKILDTNQNEVNLSSLQNGFTVKAIGESSQASSLIAKEIKIISSPSIIIASPPNGSQIKSSFEVKVLTNLAEKLNLTLTNLKTKKVLLTQTLDTSVSKDRLYQDLNYSADLLPNLKNLKENDRLKLEISNLTNKNNPDLKTDSVELIYVKP